MRALSYTLRVATYIPPTVSYIIWCYIISYHVTWYHIYIYICIYIHTYIYEGPPAGFVPLSLELLNFADSTFFVYVYMYIYIHTYTCICICICIYIYIYTYTHTRVYVYICIYHVYFALVCYSECCNLPFVCYFLLLFDVPCTSDFRGVRLRPEPLDCCSYHYYYAHTETCKQHVIISIISIIIMTINSLCSSIYSCWISRSPPSSRAAW